MESNNALLLIPGIIYVVGLVSLLQIFRNKVYWETVALAVLMFLILIVNWFLISEKLGIGEQSLAVYTLAMVSPLLFTRACNVLSPGENIEDSRSAFFSARKTFFVLLGTHTLVNILTQFLIVDDGLNAFRFIAVLLLYACAFFNKLWLRVFMMFIFTLIFAYVFTTSEVTF